MISLSCYRRELDRSVVAQACGSVVPPMGPALLYGDATDAMTSCFPEQTPAYPSVAPSSAMASQSTA
ncbi:hypothetical protein ZWY2020_047151 [Hordeum vulgare]|nr:hypothetical protein ZWY2020_047151 [Hordeum vulgare]